MGSTGVNAACGEPMPELVSTAAGEPSVIGRYADTPGGFLAGYLDEIRVSKGIARWTNSFTPPSQPY